jgi:histidinol-phosphate/aromatic aminotransferase/cobyric acid decarboxylase-like protein
MNQAFKNCYHGGAFFDAIGAEFTQLERRHRIINADVLDAWFEPSPKVIAALTEELPWLLRTSPPTHCEGLIRVLARTRSVPEVCLLPGAGSSDLIFLALCEWLTRDSRVLILDPMYGEYAHVLETVVECHVDRLPLERAENYRMNLDQLTTAAARDYDLIILVNPNSPTGQQVPRAELEKVLPRIPVTTRVWVDETYVEYAGTNQSVETLAAMSENLVVCKSMSKVYALSGVRAAYLCGPERLISALRHISPPWAVSLPAQVAAIAALQDPDYYATCWRETHQLRDELVAALQSLDGWEILPGIANFLLCHLPQDGATAAELVQRCQPHGLFLRDVGNMGTRFGNRALRIAVKDRPTNHRLVEIISRTWRRAPHLTRIPSQA